ncbi:MAG TPA: glycosyltransferase [Candidatus Brocadiaceae bacterium]
MKILLFSTFFLPAEKAGGVPFCTFCLARSLQSLGSEIAVITSNRNGEGYLNVEPDQWMEYLGIPIVYCKVIPGHYLFAPRMSEIARDMAKHSDIIISSSTLWNHAGWLADRIAYQLKIPHIVYPHGILESWALQYKAFRKKVFWFLQGKRILKRASYIIALTEQEKNTIRDLGIHTPIEIIPNGVDPSDLSDTLTQEELVKIFPQLRGNRYLLFLGRIHKIKGIDLLLPAFEEVCNSLKDVILVMAGPVEKIYENEFSKLFAKYKTTGKILLIGSVKDKAKNSLLRYASGFILTSYSEGLPIAVLEALSVGCPVIISHQCNLPGVKEANTGWVVSMNINEVKMAIYELFANKREANLKGENGKRLIQESFSWEIVGKHTMDILKSLNR